MPKLKSQTRMEEKAKAAAEAKEAETFGKFGFSSLAEMEKAIEALRNPAVLEVLEANTAQDFRDREHEYANSKKIEEGLENILSYSVKSATGMETTP